MARKRKEKSYGQWVRTGETLRVQQIHRVPDYDSASRKHLWTVMSVFEVDPANFGDNAPRLGRENLLLLQGPGCFYCGVMYGEPSAYRPCDGKLPED